MRFAHPLPPLCAETPDSLRAALEEAGHPGYRADQVLSWVFKKKVADWSAMTNLPAALREDLAARYGLRPLERVLVKQASDVTEKLLFRLEDGAHIETVLIRYPQRGVGQDRSRHTVCISTQVGCAYGCRFCASGLDGWKRDLTAGEILAQLVEVCRLEAEPGRRAAPAPGDGDGDGGGRPSDRPAGGALVPFDNVVVMGMGEPLANYDNLMRALTALNADWGLRFGARRITVSTSGLVPQILRLAGEPMQFRLALSLHGATDEVRERIMPINRKYPLAKLLPAARRFAQAHGRMLTLEYILIEDVNDGLDQARALADIARDLHAHVNLIPYNRVEGLDWKRPGRERQDAFHRTLTDARASATIRREKGHDIDAACGQLRLRTERDACR